MEEKFTKEKRESLWSFFIDGFPWTGLCIQCWGKLGWDCIDSYITIAISVGTWNPEKYSIQLSEEMVIDEIK